MWKDRGREGKEGGSGEGRKGGRNVLSPPGGQASPGHREAFAPFPDSERPWCRSRDIASCSLNLHPLPRWMLTPFPSSCLAGTARGEEVGCHLHGGVGRSAGLLHQHGSSPLASVDCDMRRK